MKVKTDITIKLLSGRMGALVFYYKKKNNVLIAREYVEPELTEHNHEMGSIAKNLGVFFKSCSDGYRNDLKSYADRLNLETLGGGPIYNPTNLLFKMMYALQRSYPDVNLVTITPDDVVTEGLPVITVCQAVENELLPMIERYEDLDENIVNS